MTDHIIVEGWCIGCGKELDGQPIDGPELCPECQSYEAAAVRSMDLEPAVDAVASAFYNHFRQEGAGLPSNYEEAPESIRQVTRGFGEFAVTAAAPHIKAAALRDAATAIDDPHGETEGMSIDHIGGWLRDRADQIERGDA